MDFQKGGHPVCKRDMSLGKSLGLFQSSQGRAERLLPIPQTALCQRGPGGGLGGEGPPDPELFAGGVLQDAGVPVHRELHPVLRQRGARL